MALFKRFFGKTKKTEQQEEIAGSYSQLAETKEKLEPQPSKAQKSKAEKAPSRKETIDSYIKQLHTERHKYENLSREALVKHAEALKADCARLKKDYPELQDRISKTVKVFCVSLIRATRRLLNDEYSVYKKDDQKILALLEQTKGILSQFDEYLLTKAKPKKETDSYKGYDKETVFDTWTYRLLLEIREEGLISRETLGFHMQTDSLHKREPASLSVVVPEDDKNEQNAQQLPKRSSP